MCIVCNNPPPQLRQVTIWTVTEDGQVHEDRDAWVWDCCPEHGGKLAFVGGLKSLSDVWPWAKVMQPGYYPDRDKAWAYTAGASISTRLGEEYLRRADAYRRISYSEETEPLPAGGPHAP